MSKSESKGGLGLIAVVQVVLIILKLCHLINWSWWVVLIPLWIDLLFVFIIIIAFVLVNFFEERL